MQGWIVCYRSPITCIGKQFKRCWVQVMNRDLSCESYFVVICPGCQRRVSVALSNFSKRVSCLLCRTQFRAVDPQARSAAEDDPMQYWAEFTDRVECDEYSDPSRRDLFRIPR